MTATTTIAVVDGHRVEYRLQPGTSGRCVVVLHGGHMSAHCEFGEQTFTGLRDSVLVVSRPGYGRTEVGAGPSAPEFVARLAGLCRRLELANIAVVGISLGARSAVTMAVYYPDLVDRVVLMCPTSFRPWPELRTRRLAQAMFNPVTERLTWGTVHQLLRSRGEAFLPTALSSLSSLDPHEAVRRLGADRRRAIDFLLSCRSRSGFMIDLRPPTDLSAEVTQPTLVVATRNDGAVSFDHPEHLAQAVPNARLVVVDAPSHLLWLGDGAAATEAALASFLRP